MKFNRITIISGLVALLGSGLNYLCLQLELDWFGVLIVLGTSLGVGWTNRSESTLYQAITFIYLALISLLVPSIGFYLGDGLFNPFSHLSLLYITSSGFTLGCLRNQKKQIWKILIIGSIAFLGSVPFAYLGNEDWGILGKFLLFFLLGLNLRHSRMSLLESLIGIAPYALFVLISIITGDGFASWLFYFVQPLLSVLAFLGGFYFINAPLIRKVTIPFACSLLLFATIKLSKEKLYEDAWEHTTSQIPDISLLDKEGKTVSLNQFKGKIIYLDFWGSKCGPCLQQLPVLGKVASGLQSETNFVVLSVDSKRYDSFEAFSNAAHRFQDLNIELLYDPTNELLEQYEVKGLPTGVLIDRNGKAVKRKIGFYNWESEWFVEDLKDEIDTLIQ